MRPIKNIIIQMVEIENSAQLIHQHKDSGMAMVGFHYMIEADGTIVIGRAINNIGNHYVGENSNSIGVAVIGNELTELHESAIDTLLDDLSKKGIGTKNVYTVENEELKIRFIKKTKQRGK